MPKPFGFCLLLILAGWLPSPTAMSASQTAETAELGEMDLINRVAEFQELLNSDRVSERDKAQADLVKLGPNVLDHLEDPDDNTRSDVRERLAAIRSELETILVRDIAKPSQVSISQQLTVDDALRELYQQTGNDIAMSDEASIDTGQRSIALDLKNGTFWEAVNSLCTQANLTIDPYSGNASQLRLIAHDDQATNAAPAPRDTAGIFDFQLTRVDASRNLLRPQLNHASLNLVVRWEPRIRPISIKLAAENIRAVDSAGHSLNVSNPKAVYSALVQPQIPELEFTIPLQLMDRDVDQIKRLDAVVEAILPGRMETFRFKRVGKLKPGRRQAKAGAIVTLDRVDKNEDLYGVTLSLSFEEELNALESHQSWVFENPVYLEDEQGEKSKPLAYETVRQDNSGVTITYFFADPPGERTLFYQTPAAIVQAKTTISLENIPLP